MHKINKFCIKNRKRHLFCNEKNYLKRHLIWNGWSIKCFYSLKICWYYSTVSEHNSTLVSIRWPLLPLNIIRYMYLSFFFDRNSIHVSRYTKVQTKYYLYFAFSNFILMYSFCNIRCTEQWRQPTKQQLRQVSVREIIQILLEGNDGIWEFNN